MSEFAEPGKAHQGIGTGPHRGGWVELGVHFPHEAQCLIGSAGDEIGGK